MKIKTSELIGNRLDWAAGIALGYELSLYGVESIRAPVPGLGVHAPWKPSYYWNQGGLIIEQEHIALRAHDHDVQEWSAEPSISAIQTRLSAFSTGPTPLVAAMRCFVASKLGHEVDLPEGLS